jgi:CubicO group peptidase (beta-lactamase class C family)
MSSGFRVTRVAFSPNNGWHVSGNDHIGLPAASGGLTAVRTRIDSAKIPGVAVVAVRSNAIYTSDYYGFNQRGSNNPVNVNSRFQCASVSKVVTTASVLRLIQLGTVRGLTLDTDIRGSLGVTLAGTGAGTPAVTLRQLLTHTGGFSVSGFGGYRRTVAIPNTLGILTGTGGSNSPAVTRRAADGGTWNTWLWQYSGGGITLVQRYIERVTGQTFGDWTWTNLLLPIGMTSSRFILDPAWGETSLAAGHNSEGYVLPHRRNHYPELAAAGLYATAADLARFLIAVNRGGTLSNGSRLWSANMLAATNYRGTDGHNHRMGLGVFLGTEGASQVNWGHNGVNFGFRSNIWGNPVRGNGVVVLANGDVASSEVDAIKDIYVNTYAL